MMLLDQNFPPSCACSIKLGLTVVTNTILVTYSIFMRESFFPFVHFKCIADMLRPL